MITSDLAAAIQHAVASNTVVRGVGSGTWLHGGPVENDDTATRVQSPSGVIEYTPGDLVITVHAGTTLEELSAVCAASGQMLAIAPYGSPQSTIGAVVATASAAPLSYEDLTIRDLVLGLTVVTGTGDIVRVGGKVVKNVAGFDLVRLNTGAFGTLGIITEVSVRLHAKPIMDHVVTAHGVGATSGRESGAAAHARATPPRRAGAALCALHRQRSACVGAARHRAVVRCTRGLHARTVGHRPRE